MRQIRITVLSLILFNLGISLQVSADERPAGLDQAIRNPKIPMIVDVTIKKFNDAGHGEIKVNTVFKTTRNAKGEPILPPNTVRGYGYVGSDKVAPLRIRAGGQPGRYLLFLNGDLLYSTYNHCFNIREGKNGVLEVGTGFNGGGGPWKPLKDIVALIPSRKLIKKKVNQGDDKKLVKGEKDAPAVTVNVKDLCQHWVHSREEEKGQGAKGHIFRPAGSRRFARSRFRMAYKFDANGDCQWMYLDPADRHRFMPGKWSLDAKDKTLLKITSAKPTKWFKITGLSKDILRLTPHTPKKK